MSYDEQVLEVLKFMADHTVDRPLIHEEIASTYERWPSLAPAERQRHWSRCLRRFSVAQPILALIDRIREVDDCVRPGTLWSTPMNVC